MYKFFILLVKEVAFSGFKQLPLSSSGNLELLKEFSLWLRLLSDVAGGLIISSEKTGWNTKYFCNAFSSEK